MSYGLTREESVGDGVRRIAIEELDAAVDALGGELHEAVHEARKSCKRVRALVRLVRPALGDTYQVTNAAVRDAARLLSDLRDATAVIETYEDQIAAAFGNEIDDVYLAQGRAALEERRREWLAGRDVADLFERFRGGIARVRGGVTEWELDADGWDAIAGGVAKTYGRARDAMEDAYAAATAEAFHQWRKRVKYHRYHVELLEDMWADPMDTWEDELHDLSDHLGDDHDLAVLRGVLGAEAGRFTGTSVLVGVIDRRRAQLQALARPLGDRLLAEEPDDLVDRLGAYWAAWRRPTPDPATVAAVTVESSG